MKYVYDMETLDMGRLVDINGILRNYIESSLQDTHFKTFMASTPHFIGKEYSCSIESSPLLLYQVAGNYCKCHF